MWLVAVKEKDVTGYQAPQQEMWKAMYAPPAATRRSRPETLTFPRTAVEIRVALNSRDSLGRYEWTLLTAGRRTVMGGFSEGELCDGLPSLTLRADLATQPPGDYLLGVRPENGRWAFWLITLAAEYPLRFWMRS